MLLADAPSKIVLPFANAGNKNAIPVPSQIPITPGAASWTTGFPPLTMMPVSDGGVPPSGLDFNGIYYAISALSRWTSAGASFYWDSAFATAVSGYPKGSRVLMASGGGYWRSVTDGNTTNPDTGGAGWVSEGVVALASVWMAGNQTVTAGPAWRKVNFDTIEFDTSSLWDSVNNRFVVPITGRYRFNSSILLSAPGGANYAISIFKNSTVEVRRGLQMPQVSVSDISLVVDAIVPLNIGDTLETQLYLDGAGVTVSGGNSINSYQQIEFLG